MRLTEDPMAQECLERRGSWSCSPEPPLTPMAPTTLPPLLQWDAVAKQAAARMDKILSAAEELFLHEGFDRASVASIAKLRAPPKKLSTLVFLRRSCDAIVHVLFEPSIWCREVAHPDSQDDQSYIRRDLGYFALQGFLPDSEEHRREISGVGFHYGCFPAPVHPHDVDPVAVSVR